MESHLSPVALIERDPTFWKSQGKVLEKFRNFSENDHG
jgi:hypothetical protein